jgi:hypothetical protein
MQNLAALETVTATLVAEALAISNHLRRVREYGDPLDPVQTRNQMAGMQRNLTDLNDLLEAETRAAR